MDDAKNDYSTDAGIEAVMARESLDLDTLELQHQRQRFGAHSTAKAQAVRAYIDRQRRGVQKATEATNAALARRQTKAAEGQHRIAFVGALITLAALVVAVLAYLKQS